MPKIRPETAMAGLLSKTARPMNKIGAKGFYIQSVGGRWWVKRAGGAILANLPYTIESPHLGQIETRIHFGEIAKRTAGRPLRERLETIRREMTGYRAPDRITNPAQYPSRQSYHTLDELKRMLEKKTGYAKSPEEVAVHYGLERMGF